MADYKAIRKQFEWLREANVQIHRTLSADIDVFYAVMDFARKLGLLIGNTFVLDDTKYLAIFQDHIVYARTVEGELPLNRYARAHPPEEGSNEQLFIERGKQAFYAVLSHHEAVPGVGVHCTDILRDRAHFLADIQLSQLFVEGHVTTSAAWLIDMDEFLMTTGAVLHPNAKALEGIGMLMDNQRITPERARHWDRQDNGWFAEKVIRVCLDHRPASPEGSREDQPEEYGEIVEPIRSGPRIGRNAPCPCGSGRKYKKCCLGKEELETAT